MGDFTPEQEEAIESKIRLYSPLVRVGITRDGWIEAAKGIEEKIVQKRLAWFEEHRGELDYLQSDEMIDIDKAFLMIYGDYMGIDPNGLRALRMSDADQGIISLQIDSSNFCPYLEAFKRMGLQEEDSVWLCEHTLERPCQEIVNRINPKVKFFRNYQKIRPRHDCCEEGLVTRDYELIKRLEAEDATFARIV